MSDESRPIWLLSEQEVLEWFKQAPRTWGWQVLVALDRFKTNQLLAQEYIDKYAQDKYFPPLTDSVTHSESGTQTWEYLYDHVLGPPRLSFENSDMNDWARITMPITGGIQMSVEQAGMAPRCVTGISWYDPLQAPRLICEIRLEDTAGEVDYSRLVKLDLRKGVNFRLTDASTFQGQQKGGSFYLEKFKLIDEDKQRFILGKLGEVAEGAVLDPDKFRLRALSARPARSGEEEGDKEGAILLFIGTKGHDPTGLPDKDSKWVYPIPEGRSSTMLIGNSVIFKELLEQGIRDSGVTLPEYEFITEDGIITGIKFTGGLTNLDKRGVRVQGIDQDLNIFGSLVLNPEQGVAVFTVSKVEDEIHMDWRVTEAEDNYHWARLVTDDNPESSIGAGAWVQCGLESKYRFEINEKGSVELVLAQDEIAWAKLTPYHVHESFQPHFAKCLDVVKAFIEEQLITFQRQIADGIQELEIFTLYGLLFTSSQVVQQRSVHLPCDLAVFGDIAPNRTAFRIDPIEKDIIHGGKHQFTLLPAQSGVTWKLEEVPGFAGELGTISQSGAYTAPIAAQIPESQAYTMVRVIASKGDVFSSALVRVVRRSVVVNPMVVAASQNVKKVRFSGGALGGDKLEWSLETKTGARLTATPPEEDAAEFDEADMFYVPGTGSTGDVFSIETVTVKDASGNTASADLVLTEKEYIGRVTIKDVAGLPEGKVQLQLEGAKEPMTSDADWKVISGGGTVDENGLFTVDTDSPYKYAVVTGTYISPVVDFFGYIILPVPLVDLDDIKRALDG